ncbi:MAG: zinc-ribbon domain-containing protein [Bacilli bacterium]|nr:zinc-ribbon domain-containing protein [Bacilli bacterium]
MKKFCTICGKPMDSDATFCIECGNANKGEYKSGIHINDDDIEINRLAITGVVLSFMVPFIGLGLSIGGLVYAKKHDDAGKKAAITGIILSSVFMTLWFVLKVLAIILQK